MRNAYILKAVRTPGCRYRRGKFANVRPDFLASEALKGLFKRTGVDPERVEDVILGCSFPEGEQGMNVARMVAMNASLSYEIPGQTVNRFCASGLQAISMAAERIMGGYADCIVAGGTESMTKIPMGGKNFSASPELVGSWPGAYANMGITAEKVAEKYNISRERQDEFGLQSNRKALQAIEQGKFKEEIIPVEVERTKVVNEKLEKTTEVVDIDDGPRDSTLEKMAKLKPAFGGEDGTMTAANSTPLTDGASAVLVASEEWAKERNLPVLAYLTLADTAAVDYLGNSGHKEGLLMAPAYGVPRMLDKAGLSLQDFDYYEIHEAFAAQVLTTLKAWEDETFCRERLGRDAPLGKVDREKLNVKGSSLAAGHPFAATGGRILANAAKLLNEKGSGRCLISICAAGGQGVMAILEK